MDHESEPLLKLRSATVAGRSFGEETVVLDLRDSLYLSTNSAGTVLWRLLETGATRTEMVDALLAEFDVGRERAGLDVDAFVAECRRRELLDEAGAPDPG